MTSLTFNRIPKCHFRGISLPDGQPQHCPQCIANKLNYCGAVDMELGTRLQAIVVKNRFERGQTLFTQEDSADYVFALVAGVVSCSHYLDDGRRQIIAFLFPGDYIGMTTGTRYTYSAEAVTDGIFMFDSANKDWISASQACRNDSMSGSAEGSSPDVENG